MIFAVQTLIAALLAGFVLSLAMSQVFQMLHEQVSLETDMARFMVVVIMVLAAPHILAQTAGKSGRQGVWPLHYVYGCYGLSVLWAAGLGYCVILMMSR
jgi:hypothetical protein